MDAFITRRGGVSGKLICTVNGACGEVVTIADYDGEVIETVQLDSAGTRIVELRGVRNSALTFTGSISGYVKSVIIGKEEERVVNVFPDGALYWYGREFAEITGGWSSRHNGSNSFSAVKQTNAIRMTGSYSSGNDASHGGVGTTSKVNVQNYKTLYALVNVTNDCQASFFSVGSNLNNATSYAEGSAIAKTSGFAYTTGVKTVKLTSITYAAHVGVTIVVGANYGRDGSANVLAVWME